MIRQLRVFVSSTMKDLANERSAVVNRIKEFNLQPVNAENWGPDGKRSWPRIEQEIESCHLFVLILGERYGWTPDKGPKANLGLSVTHLEYNKAQELGLCILPFLKKLEYEADHSSEDAKQRDAFREAVKNWKGGLFVGEFELAHDLAQSVGEAIMTVLTERFARTRIRKRSAAATKSYLVLARDKPKPKRAEHLVLPDPLIEAVASRRAVLFAGSGVSLAAGLPSAAAFAQRLTQLVRKRNSAYQASPAGSALAGIATDLEAARGRPYLMKAILGLLQPPQGIEPTSAHLHAVRLFDRIFTTNFDSLFEDALDLQRLGSTLIYAETRNAMLPERAIVKLHGSAHEPDSLLLTERDVLGFDRTRPRLWQAIVETLKRRPVVVVGSSLHDPSIVRLFTEVGAQLSGFFVAPGLWEWTPQRLSCWNLKCIATDADPLMSELTRQVEGQG